MTIKERVENDPALWAAALLIVGFVAGFGAYRGILEIAGRETVAKDSYVLNSEVVGTVVRSEVIGELNHLIEIGSKIAESNEPKDANVFLSRSRAFLVGLNLPKDTEFSDDKMSSAVFDHQMIMMRHRYYGHENITLSQQVSRITGLLRGLRSSYRARAGGVR